METLPDIQQMPPGVKSDINVVGVKGVGFLFEMTTRDGKTFTTDGELSVGCFLGKDRKGVDMSRFVSGLSIVKKFTTRQSYLDFLNMLQDRIPYSEQFFLKASTRYFMEKKSPVSQLESYLPIDYKYIIVTNREKVTEYTSVRVPYLSLCPCSKEISEVGAHNQRSYCTVVLESSGRIVWIEDIVEIVERHSSSPIWELLKRVDEKWVTETSYRRPRFVEDMVRLVEKDVKKISSKYWIMVEHEESIHLHNAFAFSTSATDISFLINV